MDMLQEHIREILGNILPGENIQLETPPDINLGDYSFPVFQAAKKKSVNPVEFAEEIAAKIRLDSVIKEITTVGPYINFFIRESAYGLVLKSIREDIDYGTGDEGSGITIVIDFSSPNIAKPFGIGHLRSTVIGSSICRILKKIGYSCIGVNHLGDWGTQFGKLITAYVLWGDGKKLEENPIYHLYDLYVKFHEEAEINPELNDKAREWSRKIESGDTEAIELWGLFKQVTLEEFKRYYENLNVHFDSWEGESFYNDKIDSVIALCKAKEIVEVSDGALIVNLEKYGLPPFLLRRSDGTSLYAARDLAAAIYRLKEYGADKLVYVVGAPQKLHFKQLFKTLHLFGEDESKFVHVDFGHIRFPEGKMSTRKGNIIFLEHVLDESIMLARKIIEEKNPKLPNKDEVANIVGIGAVIFGDLVNDRVKDVSFSWERILDFEGETAPYCQYAHARISAILRKSGWDGNTNYLVSNINEVSMVKLLMQFPEKIRQAAQQYRPSILARYAIEIAQAFNVFYEHCPVLTEKGDVKSTRLAIVEATGRVLKETLNLLGVEAPEEM